MGGALALCSLAACDDIIAGAPNYGYGDCFDPTKLTKPVLWTSGKLDAFTGFSDPATAEKLKQDLTTAGNKDFDVKVYPGVGHAFLNESPEPYKTAEAANEDFLSGDYGITKPSFFPVNPTIQELAWGRIIDFLAKWLKD